jgi:hypothetical protein
LFLVFIYEGVLIILWLYKEVTKRGSSPEGPNQESRPGVSELQNLPISGA